MIPHRGDHDWNNFTRARILRAYESPVPLLDLNQVEVPSRPFHWDFKHCKDFPIMDDKVSIAHLETHLKPAGCLPPVNEMTERQAYIDMAKVNTQVIFGSSLLCIF